MKMLLLLLTACLGTTLFASESHIYRDEDSGLVMTLPSHIERTWHLSHFENGIEFNVFQSELDDESFCFITTGRMPLKSILGEGSEGSFPLVMEQLHTLLDIDDEDVEFQFEILPSLAKDEYCGIHYRLHLRDDDWEEAMHIDIHVFTIGTCSHVIVTGMYPSSVDELDAFSGEILAAVDFIEE